MCVRRVGGFGGFGQSGFPFDNNFTRVRADRENAKIADTILAIDITDPELRQWASRMLFAARWLERVGDHAVNVAERVTYMVTGETSGQTNAGA